MPLLFLLFQQNVFPLLFFFLDEHFILSSQSLFSQRPRRGNRATEAILYLESHFSYKTAVMVVLCQLRINELHCNCNITARKQSLRRLWFYKCLSVKGGSASVHAGIADTPPREQISPRADTPPAQCMLGDTTNNAYLFN